MKYLIKYTLFVIAITALTITSLFFILWELKINPHVFTMYSGRDEREMSLKDMWLDLFDFFKNEY